MKGYTGKLGVARLLFAAVAWGAMFPVFAVMLVVVDPFHLTVVRYGITAVVFLALLGMFEGPRAFRLEGRAARAVALGTTGFAGFGLLAIVGLQHSTPEHGAIIMATQPLVAAVAGWWLRGARPTRATLACLAVALAGVVLVVTKGHWTELFAARSAWGDLLIFLGAVSWVVYSLGASEFPALSPLRYTALTCALGMPAVLVATAIASHAGYVDTPTLADLASIRWELAFVIAFSSVLAVLAWNAGLRAVGPTNGMLFINFVPVTAFAIGIAQGHRFHAVEFVGAALVIGALIVNTMIARRRASSSRAVLSSEKTSPRLRPRATIVTKRPAVANRSH